MQTSFLLFGRNDFDSCMNLLDPKIPFPLCLNLYLLCLLIMHTLNKRKAHGQRRFMGKKK